MTFMFLKEAGNDSQYDIHTYQAVPYLLHILNIYDIAFDSLSHIHS